MLSKDSRGEKLGKAPQIVKSETSKQLDYLLTKSLLLKRPVTLKEAKNILSPSVFVKVCSKAKTDYALVELLKKVLIKRCIAEAPEVKDFEDTVKLLGNIGKVIPIFFTDPKFSLKKEAIKYLRELLVQGIQDSNNLLNDANSLLRKKQLPFIFGLECLVGDHKIFISGISDEIKKREKSPKLTKEKIDFIQEIIIAASKYTVGPLDAALKNLTFIWAFPEHMKSDHQYDLLTRKVKRLFGSWENAHEAAIEYFKESKGQR